MRALVAISDTPTDNGGDMHVIYLRYASGEGSGPDPAGRRAATLHRHRAADRAEAGDAGRPRRR